MCNYKYDYEYIGGLRGASLFVRYVNAYVYVYAYVHVHVCVYVYVYVNVFGISNLKFEIGKLKLPI